jgi:hypothetical protein
MNSLFLHGIEPRDKTYRYIRDDPGGAEAKAFVERLWGFYSPYADSNFKSAIASSFHAKFWEMYLAFGLAAQGAKLQRTPSKGPDLMVQGLTHPVWIEATVPTDGMGVDRVPEECIGTNQDIPSDSLILRYRTRIDEKFQKLCGCLKAGIVKDSDPYIIAINSQSLSFGLYEPRHPRILQALFPHRLEIAFASRVLRRALVVFLLGTLAILVLAIAGLAFVEMLCALARTVRLWMILASLGLGIGPTVVVCNAVRVIPLAVIHGRDVSRLGVPGDR